MQHAGLADAAGGAGDQNCLGHFALFRLAARHVWPLPPWIAVFHCCDNRHILA
jgi:hypothetical protein